MERWEYKVCCMPSQGETWKLRDMLHEMGRQGWELVAVPVSFGTGTAGEMSFIFKRKAHG